MNPALIAATVASSAAAEKRKKLLARIQSLPPAEATRERVLEVDPSLAPQLDALLAERILRKRADGTLRLNIEAVRARSSANAKVGLLVIVVLLAVAAAVVLLLLLD